MMTHEEDYGFARACMGPNEQVLWRGKPQKGRLFTSGDLFVIPFILIWCGFMAFWMHGVIESGAPIFFPLFGSVGVIFGMYMLFGRFIWAAYIRKRTAYVITNKKIIRRRGSKMNVLAASTMPPAQTVFYKDGSGTIRFQTQPQYYRRGNTMYWQMHITGMDFGSFSIENVPEVNRVLQVIDQMERFTA